MFGYAPFEEEDEITFDSRPEGWKPHQKVEEELVIDSRKNRSLSGSKKDKLLEEYNTVCVNDFNDTYHMCEEDRRAADKMYEIRTLVQKQKTKYSNIVEFIKAYRNYMIALNYIADENGIYSPYKFKKKVIKGKIKVNGLIAPRYNAGKKSKKYNWDLVAEYIGNPDNNNFSILLGEIDESTYVKLPEYTDSDEDRRKYFTEDQYEIMFNNNEEVAAKYKDIQVARVKKRKKSKEILPNIDDIVRQMYKDAQKNAQLTDIFAYDIFQDDFNYVAELDRKYRADIPKPPKFKGSVMNDSDVKAYLFKLDDWYLDHTVDEYHGRLRTLAEIEELELKDSLEKAGWNIRALGGGGKKKKKYNPKKEAKKNKKDKKKNKKKEDNRMVNIRMNIESKFKGGDGLNYKEHCEMKRKEKNERKGIVEPKEEVNCYNDDGSPKLVWKDGFMDYMDKQLSFIQDGGVDVPAAEKKYTEGFDAYEEDMTDMSWENIKNSYLDENKDHMNRIPNEIDFSKATVTSF